MFSVIRCIRTNTVYKNSLVRHEKFIEFPYLGLSKVKKLVI